MEDIVLGEPGATVVVELQDKAGEGVADTEVRLIADSAGYPTAAQGSWLHPLGFRQLAVTSAQGQVRFTGVPPGRIMVRRKTPNDSIEQQAVATSNQELRVSRSMP